MGKIPESATKCWSPQSLSKISSLLGKPIQSDRLTASMDRISYARVLVEINLMEDLPCSVRIGLPNGSLLEQPVIYEYLPVFCRTCHVIGYSTANCGKQTARSSRARGKASKRDPSSNPKGGSSSLRDFLAIKNPAETIVTQSVPIDTEIDKSTEGWVRVARKSKTPPLERAQQLSKHSSAGRTVQENRVMNADPDIAPPAVLLKEPFEMFLEKNVIPGDSPEPNLAEVVVNNKGKAVDDPPESSCELGEKKKWKKTKKGAKGGLIPRAQS